MRVFTYSDKLFFPILDDLQNAYVTLNIYISDKRRPKIKTNISKFKLAHWQSTNSLFFNIPLLLCVSRLIKQEYFFGVTRYTFQKSSDGSNRSSLKHDGLLIQHRLNLYIKVLATIHFEFCPSCFVILFGLVFLRTKACH